MRARDESGRPVDHKSLDRRAFRQGQLLGRTHYGNGLRSLLAVRKLIQKAGIKVSSDSGNEGDLVPQFLNALQTMADKAERPPLPQRPDTRLLDELRVKAGNEQLLALYEYRGQLSSAIDEWKATAEAIQQRLPLWNTLRRLTAHARDLSDAQPLLERVDLIEEQRQLLGEADPLMPLVQDLTQLLRDKLNGLNSLHMAKLDEGD